MYSKKIVKLGEKFSKKYSFTKEAATDSLKVKQDIINKFPEKMEEMSRDNISINLTLGYEEGISTWFRGAKIELKDLKLSESASDAIKDKYNNFVRKDLLNYVNTPNLGYEGGPWTFDLP